MAILDCFYFFIIIFYYSGNKEPAFNGIIKYASLYANTYFEDSISASVLLCNENPYSADYYHEYYKSSSQTCEVVLFYIFNCFSLVRFLAKIVLEKLKKSASLAKSDFIILWSRLAIQSETVLKERKKKLIVVRVIARFNYQIILVINAKMVWLFK